jgi:hypothetical protein
VKDRSVHQIIWLLQGIAMRLNAELLRATGEDKTKLEGQLRAVEAAVAHFRAGLDIIALLEEVQVLDLEVRAQAA